jgi:hypothetical protein
LSKLNFVVSRLGLERIDPESEPEGAWEAAAFGLERIDPESGPEGAWDAHLALADNELLKEQIGPVAGPWADGSKAGYVLHMLDEFVHHGAEISLLRDLWYWKHQTMEMP